MIKKLLRMTLVSLFLWSSAATTTTLDDDDDDDDECVDAREKCPTWAEAGDCRERAERMLMLCPKSCHICELQNRTTYFGVRQECKGREAHIVAPAIQESIVYMNSDKAMNMDAADFLQCVNEHASCSHWKTWGGTLEYIHRLLVCVLFFWLVLTNLCFCYF